VDKWLGPTDKVVWRNEDRAYAPILEELIEACGDRFSGLTLDDDGIFGAHDREYARTVLIGRTPGEAVARLWLALHSKQ
jgi:hypothetical protein